MRTVQELGGFSLGQADILRRIMGKKGKEEEMDREKHKFIYGELDKNDEVIIPGCLRNGISLEVAEEVWEQMEDFNKYAFNKSHAAGYSLVAIKTAYLKYYYPVDFMTSTISVYVGDPDKTSIYLGAVKEMGIDIIPPSLNHSLTRFSKLGKDIMFGFLGIKNIAAMANKIVEEREDRGEFESIQDFIERMATHQSIGKKVLEGLAYSGALDSFGYTRRSIVEATPLLLKDIKKEREKVVPGQISFADFMPEEKEKLQQEIPYVEEFEKMQKLTKEKEYTEFYLSEHPLDDYEDILKDENIVETHKFVAEKEVDEKTGEITVINSEVESGQWVKVAGIITNVFIRYRRSDGRPMATFSIEDSMGIVDAVIFTKKYDEYFHQVQEGKIVMVEGKYQINDMGSQIIVDSIVELDKMLEVERRKQYKAIGVVINDQSQIKQISHLISLYPGNIPVYIKFRDKVVKSDKGLSASISNILKLENIVGVSNMKIA